MLGPLCAFLASFTWVTGSSAYAHLSRKYVPAAINFNRALVALPLFAIVALFEHQAVLETIRSASAAESAGWLALSVTASYVLGDGLFLYACLSIGFTAAQAITATYPIWATLAAVTFSGEAIGWRGVLGLMAAISGVIMVVVATRQADHQAPPENLAFLRKKSTGVLIAFITSLTWALNSFAISRGGHTLHLAFSGGLRMCVALLLTPLVARVQTREGPVKLAFERADYRRFVPIIAFEAFIGSAVYIYGLSHSSMAVGATLSSLAPVLSVPIAVVLGWERFSWAKTLGVCVVVAGVTLLLTA